VALFAFNDASEIDRAHRPAVERTPASHFGPESVERMRLFFEWQDQSALGLFHHAVMDRDKLTAEVG
jgi:hypothetical protein